MYQFIETMLVMNGEIVNSKYHDLRLNKTLNHFNNVKSHAWNVVDIMQPLIDKFSKENQSVKLDNYKARIQYNIDGVEDISLTPYVMRLVSSLKCVYNDKIDYTYKSTDRCELNKAFSQRGECDDAIIIRDGLVADTTIANVAFWNGKEWLTPRNPLLKGTRRASLIDNGIIKEDDICVDDLNTFKKVRLFNALIDWGKIEINDIKQIHL